MYFDVPMTGIFIATFIALLLATAIRIYESINVGLFLHLDVLLVLKDLGLSY